MCVCICGLCNFKRVYWIGLYRLEIGPSSRVHMHVGEPENLVASQSKSCKPQNKGLNDVTLLNTEACGRHAYVSLKERSLMFMDNGSHSRHTFSECMEPVQTSISFFFHIQLHLSPWSIWWSHPHLGRIFLPQLLTLMSNISEMSSEAHQEMLGISESSPIDN